jgi:hypothetical protein
VQLVKIKRNAMIEAVVAGGLDPRECDFDFGDSESRITHVPSGSSFLLEGDPGQYMSTMTIGDDLPLPVRHYSWPPVEERVGRWAREVKRDLDVPDLWAGLQRERELLTGTRYEDVENTRFTSDELAEIAEHVAQIKEFVKTTYSLSKAQMLSLEAQLDDMEAAAGRIGRKDWQLLVRGAMLTLVVEALLPREVVWHVLVMTVRGLDHLFGGGSGTPELPGLTPIT